VKIVHVVEATAAGTLAMVALLANAQAAKENYEVCVIFSRRVETPSGLGDLFDRRIIMRNIQMVTSIDRLKSFYKIRRTVDELDPDVVVFHSSFAGFLGRLATLGTRARRYVYVPHCISFMRKDIGHVGYIGFLLLEWIGALKRCDYIACSESERNLIASRIPFRRCILVENAVKFEDELYLSRRDPAARSVKNSKMVVTVAQVRMQKGPARYAEIARAVKERDSSVRFVWVGGGGDAGALRFLEESGVEVTGWVSKKEVVRWLCEADLYLSTSEWEGLPVSVIEAMHAGLPAVVSNCSGNVDVVKDGRTGWIFRKTEEAADILLSVLFDSKRMMQTAHNAREEAQRRFSSERYVEEMTAALLGRR